MMASPNSELSLDCNPHTYSMLLKSFGGDNTSTHQLEEYLSCLEDERLKIDGFKRELPLCVNLLSNAVEASRQQLQSYKATTTNQGTKRPILEEFIPMKHPDTKCPPDQQKPPPNTASDKASWMTSAQLWSPANEGPTTEHLEPLSTKLSLLDNNKNDSNKRQKNGAGPLLPFTKERSTALNVALAELGLASDDQRVMEDYKSLRSTTSESGLLLENSEKAMETNSAQTNVIGAAAAKTTSSASTTSQTNRKQRRCWSPDLHRRFVNALQMLGGSQVATPRQIRELMKVDGLTNDEVKSHLQKYRLHTRRPGPSPQGTETPPGPQLVILGGIWVPPEYAAAAHHHGVPGSTIYNTQPTPQVGPHYCPQEFYPPPLPLVHHHHNNHHQVHLYKAATSQGQGPRKSHGGRRERDRSESTEDGKWERLESSSGEESNERKNKLAALGS